MLEARLNGLDLFGEPLVRPPSGPVAEKFGFSPFTVLDARGGEWQERKRAWLGVGIKSEAGRSAKAFNMGLNANPDNGWQIEDNKGSGTSVFDPVLCECMYRWFSRDGSQIIDPFAGGSVRGIVAGMMNRKYWGCDLRPEQIESNREQGYSILEPSGYTGDELTPVEMQRGGWYAKREDFAHANGTMYASGAKCRAFQKMIDNQPGLPIVVGCSASSLMQVYAAQSGKLNNRETHVFVPKREHRTDETKTAEAFGAVIHEVSPGYLNVCRARAREFAGGNAVRWQSDVSTIDTFNQTANIPRDAKRVVVPCGSGAIASGVIAGLAFHGMSDKTVLLVAVSEMADLETIKNKASVGAGGNPLPNVELVRESVPYEQHVRGIMLDCGSELDGGYSAKCHKHLMPGDVLWVSGSRYGSTKSKSVEWVVGDSLEQMANAPDADFLFSCPPYGDLEVYSNNPRDLSNQEWHTFRANYGNIILQSVKRLKQNRFACFVVGDFRDNRGFYRDFVSTTIAMFRDAGCPLYNEAVLNTPVGTACMRVTNQFESGRKFAKVHQNVLVFCRGDWKKAAAYCNGRE